MRHTFPPTFWYPRRGNFGTESRVLCTPQNNALAHTRKSSFQPNMHCLILRQLRPEGPNGTSHYERPAHARKKLCCKQTRTHSCPHIHYVTFCNRGELAKGIEEGWWANPSRVQRRKLRRWSPPPRKTLSKVFIHIRGKGEQRLRSLQQNRAGSDGVEIDAKGRGILPSAPFLDLLERDS